MFTLIVLLASLFGSLAGEIATIIEPESRLLSPRVGATSQEPVRPIGPQTETIEDDVTGCLDPDGRIVPCRPFFP